MKKLHLSYDMLIEYSVEVQRCNFTIKCIPTDSCRQKVTNIKIKIVPEVVYSHGKDGLNNLQIYGVNEVSHKSFLFHIEADADTGLSDYETDINDDLDMIFNHEHGLNIAGPKIKSFIESIGIINKIESWLDGLADWMDKHPEEVKAFVKTLWDFGKALLAIWAVCKLILGLTALWELITSADPIILGIKSSPIPSIL